MKTKLTLLIVLCLNWYLATAATYTVTQITDNGTGATSGSLGWAINQATADGDVINFNLSSGDEVTLSAALPTFTKGITIEGINATTGKRVTVQVASPGVSTFRVFTIDLSSSNVNLTINDLILKGGDVSGNADDYGGVVRNNTGAPGSNLIMNRCVVRDGKAVNGGGIFGRNITINQCAISNNIATNYGGGLCIDYNGAYNFIINSTITANTATTSGGGVFCSYGSSTHIINSTISGNSGTSGGGVYGLYYAAIRRYATIYTLNSIVVNNTGNDFGSNNTSVRFYGYQTWKATGSAWFSTNTNAPNNATAYTAGDLGALADNGGATPTMQLSASAPAYHTGTYAYYNATDGYYFKGSDNLYYKLTTGSTAFTPSSANPENDKITTDQRGATRDATPSMGAYDGVVANPMQLKFTTTAGQSISLPLYGTVNCTVNWGDGSETETFTTTGDKSHTFATAGTYTVSISGSLTQFGKVNAAWAGVAYLTEVASFGDLGLTSLSGAFYNADNLTSVPATLPATVANLSYCFMEINQASITNLDLWDISAVTNISGMFQNASSFNQNIGSWNTESVTNMNDMFSEAETFNQDIHNWNVGNVTNMNFMFNTAQNFNQPIGNWNVSKVESMTMMFAGALSFNQPLASWDVSKVNNMSAMFGMSSFNQDISGWNVSNVTDMSYMFMSAFAFNQDISTKIVNAGTANEYTSWNVSNVVDMSAMFAGDLEDIGRDPVFNKNISNWDVSEVTTMNGMFNKAVAFDQNIGSWNITAVTDMEDMFKDVTLSTANYDALLTAWAAKTVKPNVAFGGGKSKYSAGAAAIARGVLTGATNRWTITDGGLNVTTDIENPIGLAISIYPNPASDFIHINGINDTATLKIIDMNGKICKICNISGGTGISVKELQQGIYIIEMQSNTLIKRFRFVKK